MVPRAPVDLASLPCGRPEGRIHCPRANQLCAWWFGFAPI